MELINRLIFKMRDAYYRSLRKRGPVFVSEVILYLLAYDAFDVMDDDNFATATLQLL